MSESSSCKSLHDGCFLVYNLVEIFSAGEFETSSFYVRSCLSPDNKFLLSGSTGGKGFIWEVCVCDVFY